MRVRRGGDTGPRAHNGSHLLPAFSMTVTLPRTQSMGGSVESQAAYIAVILVSVAISSEALTTPPQSSLRRVPGASGPDDESPQPTMRKSRRTRPVALQVAAPLTKQMVRQGQ